MTATQPSLGPSLQQLTPLSPMPHQQNAATIGTTDIRQRIVQFSSHNTVQDMDMSIPSSHSHAVVSPELPPTAIPSAPPLLRTAEQSPHSHPANSEHQAGSRPGPIFSNLSNSTQAPTTKPQNPKPRQPKNTLKYAPAIDQPSFENECLKKQLNIAHTKIKETESQLEKAKTTNHILGERIKLFEAANNKDIFEKYFPSQPSDPRKETHSPNQACGSSHHTHRCCAPPPCQAFRCHVTTNDDDLTNVVKDLSRKLLQLSNDTSALQVQISEMIAESFSHPARNQSPVPTDQTKTPLSPDLFVVDHGQHSNGSDHSNVQLDQSDSSDSNTIDDNVPSDTTGSSLNYHATTTQLAQLRQTQLPSQQ